MSSESSSSYEDIVSNYDSEEEVQAEERKNEANKHDILKTDRYWEEYGDHMKSWADELDKKRKKEEEPSKEDEREAKKCSCGRVGQCHTSWMGTFHNYPYMVSDDVVKEEGIRKKDEDVVDGDEDEDEIEDDEDDED